MINHKALAIVDWVLLENTTQRGTGTELPLCTEPDSDKLTLDISQILGAKGNRNVDKQGLLILSCLKAIDPQRNESQFTGDAICSATAFGSIDSATDITLEVLTKAKPYKINPGKIPNSVINSTAGVAAIRHKAQGANLSVSAGSLSFYLTLTQALRKNALHTNGDTYLTAVETFGGHFGQLCRLYLPHIDQSTKVDQIAAVFKLTPWQLDQPNNRKNVAVIHWCLNGKSYHQQEPYRQAVSEIFALIDRKKLRFDTISHINLSIPESAVADVFPAIEQSFKHAQCQVLEQTLASQFSTAGGLQLASLLTVAKPVLKALMICIDEQGHFGVAYIERNNDQ